MNATTAAATKTSHAIPAVPKHYHCYLLTSLSPAHPHKTYIGYTTNPHRRLRQHNGILKNGGAWRTKRSGRPWSFACILSGFSSSTAALKFEWAWQHPSRSLIFKSGCPGKSATVAKGLERRRGVKAKLDLMKVLVCASEEYKGDPLTVHFLQQETKEIFEGLLQEQRQRRLDLDEEEEEDNNLGHHHSRWCEELPRQMKLQVIDSVEEMPFFVETMKLRQKKRRRKATQRQSKRRNRSNNDNDDDGDVNDDDDDESDDHSEEDSITSYGIGQKESHDSTVSTSNILQDIVNLSLDEQRNTSTRVDRIRPTSLLYSSDSSSGKSINLLDDSDHSDDCMDVVSSDNSSSSDGTIDLTTNREIKTPDRNLGGGSQNYDCDVGGKRRIQDEMMDCPIDLISPIPIATSSRVSQYVFYNEGDNSCNSDGTIDLCSP